MTAPSPSAGGESAGDVPLWLVVLALTGRGWDDAVLTQQWMPWAWEGELPVLHRTRAEATRALRAELTAIQEAERAGDMAPGSAADYIRATGVAEVAVNGERYTVAGVGYTLAELREMAGRD